MTNRLDWEKLNRRDRRRQPDKRRRRWITRPPSEQQLRLLRDLAHRTGRTFVYPATSQAASDEIAYLLKKKPQRN